MLLITTFVEHRVVDGRSWTRAGRSHAVFGQLMLIHTCHATTLPFSDSAVSFVKVRMVTGNIRTESPKVYRIGMLLITTFVDLCAVTGRSWTRAGRPHTVFGRLMLIHTCHDMPMPCCTVALRRLFHNDMVVAWHGRCMTCVNQTRPQCVTQMGKTKSKPLTAQHGRETAWARHGNGMVCVN
jgi:hypothetical protein